MPSPAAGTPVRRSCSRTGDRSSWPTGSTHAPTVLEAWHGGTEASAAIVDRAARRRRSRPDGCRCRSRARWARCPSTTRTSAPAGPRQWAARSARRSVDIGLHGPDNVHEKYTSKYLDLELGPQFAFGHGSGYAAFSHSASRGCRTTRSTLDDARAWRAPSRSRSTSPTRPTVAATRWSRRTSRTWWRVSLRRCAASSRSSDARIEPGETVTVSFELGRRPARLLGDGCRGRARSSSSPGSSASTSAARSSARRPSSSAYADGPAGRHRVSGWAGTSCRGSRGSMTAPGVSSCHRRVLRAGPPDRPSTPADDAEAKGMRVPGNTRAVHRSRIRRASVAWSPGRTPVGGHDHDRSQAPQAARPRTHAQDRRALHRRAPPHRRRRHVVGVPRRRRRRHGGVRERPGQPRRGRAAYRRAAHGGDGARRRRRARRGLHPVGVRLAPVPRARADARLPAAVAVPRPVGARGPPSGSACTPSCTRPAGRRSPRRRSTPSSRRGLPAIVWIGHVHARAPGRAGVARRLRRPAADRLRAQRRLLRDRRPLVGSGSRCLPSASLPRGHGWAPTSTG